MKLLQLSKKGKTQTGIIFPLNAHDLVGYIQDWANKHRSGEVLEIRIINMRKDQMAAVPSAKTREEVIDMLK